MFRRGMPTSRKPGIVLILEEEKDQRYLDRLNRAVEGEGIRIWTFTQY